MADTQERQKQLNSYLETRFNPDVPPIDPQTNAIDVQIAIGPVQVQDLVDATQVLKCRVFVVMSWKDTSLAWNGSDYPNVVQTEVAPHKVWSPNVMLLNAAFGDGPLSTLMPITLVMDGSLYWQNIIMVYTICKTDLSRYPFDNQTCDITFSSAIGYPVTLHPSVISQTRGLKINANGEWETINITQSIHSRENGTSYQAAIFHIHLSRKYLFHILNLIFPMCLLSFLNSFVFLLPASSGEKMGYLMAVFVSNALFLSLIHDSMPSTSDSVSNLSIYQVAVHMQGFLAIAATILVQNIYHRQQKAMEEGAHVLSNHTKAVPLGSTDNIGSCTP